MIHKFEVNGVDMEDSSGPEEDNLDDDSEKSE